MVLVSRSCGTYSASFRRRLVRPWGAIRIGPSDYSTRCFLGFFASSCRRTLPHSIVWYQVEKISACMHPPIGDVSDRLLTAVCMMILHHNLWVPCYFRYRYFNGLLYSGWVVMDARCIMCAVHAYPVYIDDLYYLLRCWSSLQHASRNSTHKTKCFITIALLCIQLAWWPKAYDH